MPPLRSWVLAGATLALGLWPALGAWADVGVGVDLGRVALDEAVRPGGRYRLPTLTVSNPGDEAGSYRVRVTDPGEPGREAPPEAWFRLKPARFWLEPGAAQPVEISLELPVGAKPGRYAAYLEARPAGEGAGVRVGAAVATLVTFEVTPSSRWEAWRLLAARMLDDHSPWPQLAAAVLLVAGVTVLLHRRLRIHITVRRRR